MHLNKDMGNIEKDEKKVETVYCRESHNIMYVRWVVMILIKAFMHVLLKLTSHCDGLHLVCFYDFTWLGGNYET